MTEFQIYVYIFFPNALSFLNIAKTRRYQYLGIYAIYNLQYYMEKVAKYFDWNLSLLLVPKSGNNIIPYPEFMTDISGLIVIVNSQYIYYNSKIFHFRIYSQFIDY